jgi:hypothetical protein
MMRNDQGGEGSRGGKVVGHTSSGKPIYESHSHPSHTSFSAKEHVEAASLHETSRKEWVGKLLKTGRGKSADFARVQAGMHASAGKLHATSAGKEVNSGTAQVKT